MPIPVSHALISEKGSLLTDITMRPSIPTCGIGRPRSVLCRRIATAVEKSENVANTTATIPDVRAILSRPGKERKVTDALKTTAA